MASAGLGATPPCMPKCGSQGCSAQPQRQEDDTPDAHDNRRHAVEGHARVADHEQIRAQGVARGVQSGNRC